MKSKRISIIEEGLKIEGTLTCEGKLIIKGSVQGILQGDEVVIAAGGAVYCDAQVNRMAIDGTFEGELRTSAELAILSNGNCSGKVFCKNLIIESGGVLNAEVVHKTGETSTAEPQLTVNSGHLPEVESKPAEE